MLRLANEHLFLLVVVVYLMKVAVTRAVVRIVSDLTNVLKDHQFSAGAFLCAFEQVEVKLFHGSGNGQPT
jgi:hypothetical protein